VELFVHVNAYGMGYCHGEMEPTRAPRGYRYPPTEEILRSWWKKKNPGNTDVPCIELLDGKLFEFFDDILTPSPLSADIGSEPAQSLIATDTTDAAATPGEAASDDESSDDESEDSDDASTSAASSEADRDISIAPIPKKKKAAAIPKTPKPKKVNIMPSWMRADGKVIKMPATWPPSLREGKASKNGPADLQSWRVASCNTLVAGYLRRNAISRRGARPFFSEETNVDFWCETDCVIVLFRASVLIAVASAKWKGGVQALVHNPPVLNEKKFPTIDKHVVVNSTRGIAAKRIVTIPDVAAFVVLCGDRRTQVYFRTEHVSDDVVSTIEEFSTLDPVETGVSLDSPETIIDFAPPTAPRRKALVPKAPVPLPQSHEGVFHAESQTTLETSEIERLWANVGAFFAKASDAFSKGVVARESLFFEELRAMQEGLLCSQRLASADLYEKLGTIASTAVHIWEMKKKGPYNIYVLNLVFATVIWTVSVRLLHARQFGLRRMTRGPTSMRCTGCGPARCWRRIGFGFGRSLKMRFIAGSSLKSS
jgi:hypothetical protein